MCFSSIQLSASKTSVLPFLMQFRMPSWVLYVQLWCMQIHFACSSWHIFIFRIMGSFLCATLMYANLCFSKNTFKKSRQIDNISSSLKLCVFSVPSLSHGSEQSFHQWCAEGPYACALLWAAAYIHQGSETAWDLAVLWIKGSLNHSFLSWLSPLL